MKIFFWVYAIIISLGCVYNISEDLFNVYQLITLFHSWLVVYYIDRLEKKGK